MTLCAGLAVVVAWTGVKAKRRGLPFGLLVGALLVVTGAACATLLLQAQGFEPLFVRFHELFFTNDLWLMNPETDILIRMMPQLLFERAAKGVLLKGAAAFAVTGVMLAVVYAVFGGMIRRHLTERENHE